MPPKKVAAKGAKGKAKAQDKEEKKLAKAEKIAPKGKSLHFYIKSSQCVFSIVRL